MSLEKFQATEAWRNKFKNLLFTERKPLLVATSAAGAKTPQRLSFELSEDLQVILEEKRIPKEDQKMPRVRNEENKENFEQERVQNATPTKLKHCLKNDETVVADQSDVMHMTNTSFETLEEMCEKTASDPDSTLFWYLNRSSSVPVQRQRPSKAVSGDEEADALQRLLDELNVEEAEDRMRKHGQPSPDETQLEDIEAPSRLWENTLTAEALQSISPVKMVGLLRQSTIMEECSDFSESEASSTSYRSAMKTSCSSETTGCYETANETAACSERAEERRTPSTASGDRSSSPELFARQHTHLKFFDDSKKENPEESLRLIDFEATVSSEQFERDPLEHAAAIVKDSPDSPEPTENSDSSEDCTSEPIKSSPESTQLTESDGSSSVIEVSDDESLGCSDILKKIEQLESESALNRSFTIESEAPEEEGSEKSLHFNDTMEEVEYMMRKGMQYMQETKDVPSPAKSHLTPVKRADQYRSPSPLLSSPQTPKTVIAKPKPVKKYAFEVKPIPKLELFKKPQASSLRQPLVQNKFHVSAKKQQFAHVVSPIGAYIHKTATTPLVSTIKPGCSDSAANSKAFKQLEFDSRVMPKDVQVGTSTQLTQNNQPCSLPKKAYISSEFKHITDERTQFTIPGGPKIQSYLLSSMIPAVVRHEGKMKIPASMRTSDMQPSAPRRTDDSLADLSMASGDVSVYTIRDAQKF